MADKRPSIGILFMNEKIIYNLVRHVEITIINTDITKLQ